MWIHHNISVRVSLLGQLMPVSGLWICQVQLDSSSLLVNCRHPLDVHDQQLPVAFIECEMRKRLCNLASDFAADALVNSFKT